MIKNVIFDFDGTLADSFDAVVAALNEKVLPRAGVRPVTKAEIERFREIGARAAFKESKLTLLKLLLLIRQVQKETKGAMESIKPFKGIKETLVELKSMGLNLWLVSSGNRENIARFLKKNEMDIFAGMATGINLFGKDRVISKLMGSKGLKKYESVYVGDEVRDIEACRKIGLKIIAVGWGYNSPELLVKNNPEWLAEKPEEIVGIVSGEG